MAPHAVATAVSSSDVSAPPSPAGLAEVPLERIEAEICELAANINAAQARWLLLIAEFDRREGWAVWGAKTCADWVAWRCQLTPRAAREKVRVAQALTGLPKVAETFCAGKLSYSQVRAITRMATPESEDYLLSLAPHATAAQLERLAAAYRGVERTMELQEANRIFNNRYLTYYFDDDGSFVIKGRLSAEDGALVVKALEAASDAERADRRSRKAQEAQGHSKDGSAEPQDAAFDREQIPPGGSAEPHDARSDREQIPPGGSAEPHRVCTEKGRKTGSVLRHEPGADSGCCCERCSEPEWQVSNADALVGMANAMLGEGGTKPASSADTYQVVVHVDVETLLDDPGGEVCHLEDGSSIASETARRLCCDAGVVVMAESGGEALNVGRKSRVVSAPLRRALKRRYPTCVWPGCTSTKTREHHHVLHWIKDGETSPENILPLCRRHHHLVHEGGYGVVFDDTGVPVFSRPDGSVIPAVYPPKQALPGEVAALNAAAGFDIDSETCAPLWAGDSMDYSMGVEGLLVMNYGTLDVLTDPNGFFGRRKGSVESA